MNSNSRGLSVKTTIYLSTGRGVAVITGSDRDWHGEVRLQDQHVQCVAAGVNGKGIVYCGTLGEGAFVSGDGGSSWRPLKGLRAGNVTSFAVSNSGVVYAGSEPSALFRSEDAGDTWRELPSLLTLPSSKEWSFPPRPETHHVRSIFPDLVKPNRLHVAIEAGALLRSDDGGQTWCDRVPSAPRDTHTLASSPDDPGRLHSAAGDGYFESIDGGDHWRRVVTGLEHQYCWSVAISRAHPAIVVLSASRSPYAAHFKEAANSFVYRRVGNGDWRQLDNGLSKPLGLRIPVITASRLEAGVFYLSAEGEVYRSSDGGLRWEKLQVYWKGARPEHAVDIALVEDGRA